LDVTVKKEGRQCMSQANQNNSQSTFSSNTILLPYLSIYQAGQAPYLQAPLHGACNVEVVNSLHKSLIASKHLTEHKLWRDWHKLKMKSAGLCKTEQSIILILFRCRPAGGRH
jgi:hypothetical protein